MHVLMLNFYALHMGEKSVNNCYFFSARLNKLIESQPRRSKKSNRCLLHSLDSQRSRPITPAWREVWDIMRPQCKEEVVLIEASTLHLTLENYLRKHRFCGECRTKVRMEFYNYSLETSIC